VHVGRVANNDASDINLWEVWFPICLAYFGQSKNVSYPVFMSKSSTHRMHDPGSIVPPIRSKVSTYNQMPWIKYNYYINDVPKDYDDSQVKGNSEKLHNSKGTATGATCSLELLVIEFQSIFSFWAAGLSSGGKIARLSTFMVGTQQVQEIMIYKGNNKVNKT
jgi:hypothetical protein